MDINYVELAKALATEMDKAEQGNKSNEEMKKMQEEIGTLKAEIEKTKGSDVKLEELTKVLEKWIKLLMSYLLQETLEQTELINL